MKTSLLTFLMLFTSWLSLYSQSLNCGMPDEDTPEHSCEEEFLCIDPCVHNNTDNSLYIPNDALLDGSDIIYVRAAIHIMQQSSVNPQNFENNQSTIDYFEDVLEYLNEVTWDDVNCPIFNGSPPTGCPVENDPNTPIDCECIIDDTKIRLLIDLDTDLFFHVDSLGWDMSDGGTTEGCSGNSVYNFNNYAVDEDCILNIFFVESAQVWSGCGPGYNGEAVNFVTINNQWSGYPTASRLSQLLAHEIGHNLGLLHTHQEDQVTLFSDIYPDDSPVGCSPNDDPDCSNNVMAKSRPFANWLSPLQIGHQRRLLIGSWRSKMLHVDYDANLSINITENETWDAGRVVYGDISVQSGKTLSIKCKVIMPPGGRIIVKPGGKLVVDEGQITLSSPRCHDMWEGIIVEGDPDSPQGTATGGPQGVVILDDALIEYANIAVTLFDPFANEPDLTTGGVIQATSSTFRNNKTDIEFKPYQNILPPPLAGIYNNLSKFVECTFETTDDFPIDLPQTFTILKHVRMEGVRGVSFVACTFDDQRTGPSPGFNESGYIGIQALNSFFTSKAKCGSLNDCSTFTPTLFINQYIGIDAGTFGLNQPFIVDRSKFLNNHVGVIQRQVDNAQITRSYFDVGGTFKYSSGSSFPAAGLILDGGSGFFVESDTFAVSNGIEVDNPKPVGSIAINTGEAANEIRLNSYDGLYCGNLANGVNRGIQSFDGLGYFCNENDLLEENEYDFDVPASTSQYTEVGIRQLQGAAAEATGNRFSIPPPNDETHFLNPEEAQITYFYYNAETEQEPTDLSDWVFLNPITFSNGCNSNIPSDEPPIIGTNNLDNIKTIFQVAADSLEQKLYARSQLLDNGNSAALIQSIEQATVLDSVSVQSSVEQAAPYLSREALVAYLKRSDLFSEDQQVDGLIGNPELLRSPFNWKHIEDRDIAFSSGPKEQLKAARADSLTGRTELEAEISYWASGKSRFGLLLTKHYLARGDSIGQDSARYFLERLDGTAARYSLLQLDLLEGSTSTLTADLATIKTSLSDDDPAYSRHDTYAYVLNTAAVRIDSSWSIEAIPSSYLDSLNTLAQQDPGPAGRQSAAILNYRDSVHIDPVIVFSDFSSQSKGMAAEKPSLHKRPQKARRLTGRLQVYPNPAQTQVALKYRLLDQTREEQLRILDARGELRYSTNLTDDVGTIILSISDWPSGLYYVLLNGYSQEPLIEKLIIIP